MAEPPSCYPCGPVTLKGECFDCQCLLKAFPEESLISIAEYYRHVHNMYAGKASDEVDILKYNFWIETASIEVTISGLHDREEARLKDHLYKIPDAFGGGVLCRDNWLWIHGMSDRSAKSFAKKLKSALGDGSDPHAKLDIFKSSRAEFTDKTYIDMPYAHVKAIFEESLGAGGMTSSFLCFI